MNWLPPQKGTTMKLRVNCARALSIPARRMPNNQVDREQRQMQCGGSQNTAQPTTYPSYNNNISLGHCLLEDVSMEIAVLSQMQLRTECILVAHKE
jgi:hypothetical protein